MYVVALMTDKPDVSEVRSQTRPAYRAYLRDHPDHPNVTVHHAGPTIADDGETLAGVMLLMEAPSLDEARAFVADSPFAKADVFADGDIRQFDWITGNPS